MDRREFIRSTGIAVAGFVSLPVRAVAEPTLFKLGRYYEHTGGERIHIIATAETRMWGSTLLAEIRSDGEIRPVGRSEDHAVNWREITAGEFEANDTEP